MKNKMPSEGLRLGRDSGSILCDTLKKWRFRTGWGRGKDIDLFLPSAYTMVSIRVPKLPVEGSKSMRQRL